MKYKIPNRIKEFRIAIGLTQRELALKAGISRSVLSQFENNEKNPSLKTLDRISKSLNVSISQLLEGKKISGNLCAEAEVLFKDYKNLSKEAKKTIANVIISFKINENELRQQIKNNNSL